MQNPTSFNQEAVRMRAPAAVGTLVFFCLRLLNHFFCYQDQPG